MSQISEIKRFSKIEAIRFGWNTVKSNLGFFIGVMIIIIAVNGIPAILDNWRLNSLNKEQDAISFVVNMILTVIAMATTIGFIRISLKFYNHEESNFKDIFSGLDVFWKYFGVSIVYGLIKVIGFILLVIPGIIWSIKFQFCTYLIIDQNLSVMESLKRSAVITKGAKWDLFLLGLLFVGINILGFLALGIGLLVSIPITMLATTYVYRKLLNT